MISKLSGKIGRWKLSWLDLPQGREGVARVRVEETDGPPGSTIEIDVQWWKDSQGIEIQALHERARFDVRGRFNDLGIPQFELVERGGHRHFGALRMRSVAEEQLQQHTSQKKKTSKIKAQMPDKIVKILVKVGQVVKKDSPLMIMEAMKMENEIRAPSDGVVLKLDVTSGQNVETGALLVVIE
jgi:biotin carboxyl carrier protein